MRARNQSPARTGYEWTVGVAKYAIQTDLRVSLALQNTSPYGPHKAPIHESLRRRSPPLCKLYRTIQPLPPRTRPLSATAGLKPLKPRPMPATSGAGSLQWCVTLASAGLPRSRHTRARGMARAHAI